MAFVQAVILYIETGRISRAGWRVLQIPTGLGRQAARENFGIPVLRGQFSVPE